MKINMLQMEWTDEGCVAKASGFSGVELYCPHCKELLPRDSEHRCGDQAKKKLTTGKQGKKKQ